MTVRVERLDVVWCSWPGSKPHIATVEVFDGRESCGKMCDEHGDEVRRQIERADWLDRQRRADGVTTWP